MTRPHVLDLPVNEIDSEAWGRLLASAPAATPFHSAGWLGALQRAYDYIEGRMLIVEDGGEYLGGFPYAFQNRVRMIKTVLSLPFGTYGGPLVRADAPRGIAPLLWSSLAKVTSQADAVSVRVVDYNRDPLLGPSTGHRTIPAFTHRISLTDDYEFVHRKVYKQNVRKMIRQSREKGVRVEAVTDEAGVREYARIARHTLDRRGTEPYPESLFLNVFRLMGDACLFHLAYHEDRAVAGTVHLSGGASVMNWLTSSYREFWNLRPNNALVDAVVRWAVEEGKRWYNFGGSPEGDHNLQRYKESWGAKRYDYRVWAWDSNVSKVLRTGKRIIKARR